jgi:hypothetical protein
MGIGFSVENEWTTKRAVSLPSGIKKAAKSGGQNDMQDIS